jgi:hypothetical protein
MSHLKDVNMSYFEHFIRAYKVARVLMVHGMFPNIWQTKASDILNER